MIQTISPPAASRKWLRISGGRIRLPASRCLRMPPRISQIESSTKPPPAVITQAINAAHFIAPPLFVSASERLAQRPSLYRHHVFINLRLGAGLGELAALAIRGNRHRHAGNWVCRSRFGRRGCLRVLVPEAPPTLRGRAPPALAGRGQAGGAGRSR